MRSRFLSIVLALAAGVGSTGCAEDLTPFSELAKSRVLAAEVTVQGDATRSNPKPGETADITFVVGHPAEELPVTYFFVTCVAETNVFGPPLCADDPTDFVLQLDLPSTPEPMGLEVTVPSAEELGDSQQMLVLGAFCANGPINPELDPVSFEAPDGPIQVCADPEGDGEILVLGIPVDTDDEPNRLPVVGDLTLDGALWTAEAADDAPATGCAGGDLPAITFDDETAVIGLSADASSYEAYTVTFSDGETEDRVDEITWAHVATAGELDRAFTIMREGEATDDVEWAVPEERNDIAEDGTLVRFHIIARDARGGVVPMRRAFCLTRN